MEASRFFCKKKKKIKTTTARGKVMATVVWDVHGVLLMDFTPHGATINVVHYQGTVTGVKEAALLSHGALLLHHNARPHFAGTTVNLLNTWHWEVLPHPPYNPDLAPSAVHLFPNLNKHFRCLGFQTDEDV
jgi:histone-lysine N-methyltransferase SETMAR